MKTVSFEGGMILIIPYISCSYNDIPVTSGRYFVRGLNDGWGIWATDRQVSGLRSQVSGLQREMVEGDGLSTQLLTGASGQSAAKLL